MFVLLWQPMKKETQKWGERQFALQEAVRMQLARDMDWDEAAYSRKYNVRFGDGLIDYLFRRFQLNNTEDPGTWKPADPPYILPWKEQVRKRDELNNFANAL